MSDVDVLVDEAWRDFNTDGVASTGPYKPQKVKQRTALKQVIDIAELSGGGLIVKTTKAQLDADLAHAADTGAIVGGDGTPANNGLYRKTGASGAGSWTKIADFPMDFSVEIAAAEADIDQLQLVTSSPFSGNDALSTRATDLETLTAHASHGNIALDARTDALEARKPIIDITGVAGTDTAYTGTANPVVTVIETDSLYHFRPHLTNNGAATLNVSALGARPIVDETGAALLAGMIEAGTQYLLYVGATSYRVIALNRDVIDLDARTTALEAHSPTVDITSVAGSGTAYTGTANPVITAIEADSLYHFRPHITNTGAATLNVSGLGARSLVDYAGQALLAGMLEGGAQYLLHVGTSNYRVIGLNRDLGEARADIVALDGRLDTAEPKITSLENLTAHATHGNVALGTRALALENQQVNPTSGNSALNVRTATLEARTENPNTGNAALGTRTTILEATAVSLDTRLDATEQTPWFERPGEFPVRWTSGVTLEPIDATPLSSAATVETTGLGKAYRVTGALTVGPRWFRRIEPNRTYRVRYAVQRAVAPADPLNDAVSLRMRWFTATGATVGSVVTFETLTLVPANGRVTRTFFLGGATPSATPPDGAIYARPYIETFGLDGVTDLEIIEIEDATVEVVSNAGFDARLTDVEAETVNLNDRITALDTNLRSTFSLEADIAAATIDPVVAYLTTSGDTALGEGGRQYIRSGVASGDVQSADGAWWLRKPLAEFASIGFPSVIGSASRSDETRWGDLPHVEDWRGYLGDSSDTGTLQAAINAVEADGSYMLINPPGNLGIEAQIRIKKGLHLICRGMGSAGTASLPASFATRWTEAGAGLATGVPLVLVKGEANEYVHFLKMDGLAILGNNAAPIGLELQSVRYFDIGCLHIERCTERHFYVNGKNSPAAAGIGRINFISCDSGSNDLTMNANGVVLGEPEANIGVTRVSIGLINTAMRDGYGTVIGNVDGTDIAQIQHTQKIVGGSDKAVLLQATSATTRRVRKIAIGWLNGQVYSEADVGPVEFRSINSEPSAVKMVSGDAAIKYDVMDRRNGQFFYTNNRFPMTRRLTFGPRQMHVVTGTGATVAEYGIGYPVMRFPDSGSPAVVMLFHDRELLTRGRFPTVRITYIKGAAAAVQVRLNITVASRRVGDGLATGGETTSVTITGITNTVGQTDIPLTAALDMFDASIPFLKIERDTAHADDTFAGDFDILTAGMVYECAGPTGDGVDFTKWYRPWAKAPVLLPTLAE